ncbi:hypothetical protein P4S73_28270 [Paraglaciecola sp. Hal342]
MSRDLLTNTTWLRNSFLCVSLLWLCSCTTTPPKNISNICEIFLEKRDWFDAGEDMTDKWGVPIHSAYGNDVSRKLISSGCIATKRLCVFRLDPWGRVSSAYGYSQAKTPTWADYKRETGNGWASREDFEDAMDFMGWFISKTHKINGVSKWDAELQYLNYHEGWGGYKRKSYRKKRWLQKVAKTVKARSLRYATQLKGCREELEKGWFMRLFT